MTKNTQTQNARNVNTNTNAASDDDKPSGKVTNIAAHRGLGAPSRGFLTSVKGRDQARLDNKARLMTTTSQQLAEAYDLLQAGEGEKLKASAIINRVGLDLYQGRIKGLVTPDEVSSILGNQFGFRMKGDAKQTVPAGHKDASKTPAGDGNAIRMRIVRASQAYDYAVNGNGTAWFADTPASAILNVIETLPHPADYSKPDGEMLDGDGTSLWAVYDRLAEVRKEGLEGVVDKAFNAKTIMAINAKLEGDIEVTLQTFRDTPGLREAYAALWNTLEALDEAGEEAEVA